MKIFFFSLILVSFSLNSFSADSSTSEDFSESDPWCNNSNSNGPQNNTHGYFIEHNSYKIFVLPEARELIVEMGDYYAGSRFSFSLGIAVRDKFQLKNGVLILDGKSFQLAKL